MNPTDQGHTQGSDQQTAKTYISPYWSPKLALASSSTSADLRGSIATNSQGLEPNTSMASANTQVAPSTAQNDDDDQEEDFDMSEYVDFGDFDPDEEAEMPDASSVLPSSDRDVEGPSDTMNPVDASTQSASTGKKVTSKLNTAGSSKRGVRSAGQSSQYRAKRANHQLLTEKSNRAWKDRLEKMQRLTDLRSTKTIEGLIDPADKIGAIKDHTGGNKRGDLNSKNPVSSTLQRRINSLAVINAALDLEIEKTEALPDRE